MNFEPVLQLDDVRAHRPQIMCDRRDAIGFLHSQLFGLANDRRPAGERARHSQDRQLVDKLRDFFPLNHGAFERRARHFHGAARFHLIDVIDRFPHLRTHPHEHAEHGRPRIVQTDVADEQMTARLRGGRDQPESRRGNVAGNREVARLRDLVAENADGVVFFTHSANKKIIEH